MGNPIHERTLLRAAGILGGMDALAERLQVHPALLAMWLRGTGALPQDVFLKVVDIVLERDMSNIISPPSDVISPPEPLPPESPPPAAPTEEDKP